ncbi:MAG: hypothetical protein PHW82_01140 [Bacteroidales bacterium]|nr:hypothetical protein [Bacteroidales bacterium]
MNCSLKKIFILIIAQCFCVIAFSQNVQDSVVIVDTTDASVYRDMDLSKEYQGFKNTNITIRPPKHFMEFSSDEVSGFLNTGTAASIVGFEYKDVPYIGFYENVADSAFSAVDNAKFLGFEETKTLAGYQAKFYFYGFVVDKVDIIRIMFVTGDEKQMIFLQANYPAGFDMLLRPVIVQSLLSVEF